MINKADSSLVVDDENDKREGIPGQNYWIMDRAPSAGCGS